MILFFDPLIGCVPVESLVDTHFHSIFFFSGQAVPRFLQLLGPFLKPVLSNEVSGELSGKENEGVKPAVREIYVVWWYMFGCIRVVQFLNTGQNYHKA